MGENNGQISQKIGKLKICGVCQKRMAFGRFQVQVRMWNREQIKYTKTAAITLPINVCQECYLNLEKELIEILKDMSLPFYKIREYVRQLEAKLEVMPK